MVNRLKKWTKSQVIATKAQIKADLEAGFPEGSEERLRYLRDQTVQLIAAGESSKQLEAFVHIVHTLIHHERYGGLAPTELRKVIGWAETILAAHGSHGNVASILAGELYTIQSQIYRKQGDSFSSMWLQFQADQTQLMAEVPDAVRSLLIANRQFRMGDLTRALPAYSAIDLKALPDHMGATARTHHVKCLRLLHNYREAEEQADRYLCEASTPSEERELHWEKYCSTASRDQDPRALFQAIKRGQSHFFAIYVVEGYFWKEFFQNSLYRGKLGSLAYYAKKTDLNPQKLGIFYQIAHFLQSIDDDETPQQMKLSQLQVLLSQANLVSSLDKELLIWGALGECLARQGWKEFSELCHQQYQALSLRISVGHSNDALGCLSPRNGAAVKSA